MPEQGVARAVAEERWLPVAEFPAYEVSDQGRVRSKKTGRVLRPARINRVGHMQVKLFDGRNNQHGRLVHRLVLEAFVGACPVGMIARHVDERDPSNNALANLAWGTYAENEADKRRHGTNSAPRPRRAKAA